MEIADILAIPYLEEYIFVQAAAWTVLLFFFLLAFPMALRILESLAESLRFKYLWDKELYEETHPPKPPLTRRVMDKIKSIFRK